MAVDERTFIRLHDGMPDHPKVDCLSDKAFRLLVETWCWCSRHLTDGRVPVATWARRGTPRVRAELVEAGLVELGEQYVTMHDYLDHQRSAAEVSERRDIRRSAGSLGNHNRWHVDSGRTDPTCPHCSQVGSQTLSQVRSQNEQEVSQVRSQNEQEVSQVRSQNDRKQIAELEGRERKKGGSVWSKTPDRAPDSTNPHPPTTPNSPKPTKTRCNRHANIPITDSVPACTACRDLRQAAERDAARIAYEAGEAARNCRRCDAEGQRLGLLGVPGAPPCDHRTYFPDPETPASNGSDDFLALRHEAERVPCEHPGCVVDGAPTPVGMSCRGADGQELRAPAHAVRITAARKVPA